MARPAICARRSTALNVPVESQVALFSQNSSQGDLISLKNPRALYFNDAVAVGYVRGGKVLEVAAHDPRQGVIFYALNQTAADVPRFTRDDNCLACHLSWTTLGVPGLFVFSMQTLPADKYAYASGFASDHRTSFDERWGGWYVTGSLGSIRHIGNKPISTASTADAVKAEARELKSLDGQFDTAGYLSPHSDVAALMVLEHQTHMTNLITRMGWESRLAAREGKAPDIPRVQQAAADLADYMLFVYEVPLPDKVRGSSSFRREVRRARPRRQQGPIAAAAGSRSAPDAVPVQLHDLLRRVRRAARDRQEPRLPAPLAGAVRSGQERALRDRSRPPIARRLSKSCATRRRICPRYFRQSGPA